MVYPPKESVEVGEEVDLEVWNHTVPTSQRFRAPCIVTAVNRAQCESGFMVKFRDAKGVVGELDQNWLRQVDNDKCNGTFIDCPLIRHCERHDGEYHKNTFAPHPLLPDAVGCHGYIGDEEVVTPTKHWTE